MKKYKNLLWVLLFLIPTCVYASGAVDSTINYMAYFFEAFATIHMSLFVLLPMSRLISEDNSKQVFWKIFFARIVFLLIFDIFITPMIFILDFLFVFIGAFIIIPIWAAVKKKSFTEIMAGGKSISSSVSATTTIPVKEGGLDYNLSDDALLRQFIERELNKQDNNYSSKMYPSDMLARKTIFSLIFDVLLAFYICLIFFHFPAITYIIGLIVLLVFRKLTNKFDFIAYLMKEVKARPGEKISNIVMSATSNLKTDNTKAIRIGLLLIAIITPFILFKNPVILYEKMPSGYGVRFYAFGWSNYKTAEIPAQYKGENVVSLRGNTFSNMPFLKDVELPDTITEIRGQAFLNDISLTKVDLPSNLTYLGGGAFKNCSSLVSIYLPESITYLGGESFMNAKALKEVNIPSGLTEIRGDTFNGCESITSVTIPDSVTRIGGHAFYGNHSLKVVNISEYSQLKEIGSSAFRQCYSLSEIILPADTYVNERAFKESPTQVYNYADYDIQAITYPVNN